MTVNTVTRDQDGAYVARFQTDLPDLQPMWQRTRQLVKCLSKTPDLLKTYHQILSEQEARGFIERVDVQYTTFRCPLHTSSCC